MYCGGVLKTPPVFKSLGVLFLPSFCLFSPLTVSIVFSPDGLRNLFSGFGSVASAKIIFDRETGNSKGFGFIEMGSDEEANAAIAGVNGRELDGRQIRVNEAMDKPRRDRPSGGGYGGGGGNW